MFPVFSTRSYKQYSAHGEDLGALKFSKTLILNHPFSYTPIFTHLLIHEVQIPQTNVIPI